MILPGNCTEGETRIVNNISADEFSGRVEICVNGQWGAICDDGWGLNEATIVCAQFGYTKYGESCDNHVTFYHFIIVTINMFAMINELLYYPSIINY